MFLWWLYFQRDFAKKKRAFLFNLHRSHVFVMVYTQYKSDLVMDNSFFEWAGLGNFLSAVQESLEIMSSPTPSKNIMVLLECQRLAMGIRSRSDFVKENTFLAKKSLIFLWGVKLKRNRPFHGSCAILFGAHKRHKLL